MATESVSTSRLTASDRLYELLSKSSAIVEVLRCAAAGQEPPNEEAITDTCWAVHGMLHEAQEIHRQLQEGA